MSDLDNLVAKRCAIPRRAASHAQRGGRVIGFFGSEIPVELIIAAGAFPLRCGLPMARCGANTDAGAADRYLESSFMPEVRSIAEQYLQGAFDFVDSIILPAQQRQRSAPLLLLERIAHAAVAKAAGTSDFRFGKNSARYEQGCTAARAAERLAAEIGVRAERCPTPSPDAIAGASSCRRGGCPLQLTPRRHSRQCHGSHIPRLRISATPTVFDGELAVWMVKAGETAGPPRAPSAPAQNRTRMAGRVCCSPAARRRMSGCIGRSRQAGGNVVAESDAMPSSAVSRTAIPADGSLDAIADHYHALPLARAPLSIAPLRSRALPRARRERRVSSSG